MISDSICMRNEPLKNLLNGSQISSLSSFSLPSELPAAKLPKLGYWETVIFFYLVSLQVHFLVANDNKWVNKEFDFKRPAGLRLNISSGKTLVLKFQTHLNESLLRIVGKSRLSISKPSCCICGLGANSQSGWGDLPCLPLQSCGQKHPQRVSHSSSIILWFTNSIRSTILAFVH